MIDEKSYYRQFHTPPSTWPSHMRLWCNDKGAAHVGDKAMMFGDAGASNWAMRLSGKIAHCTATVANSFQPSTEAVRLAFRIIDAMVENGSLSKETQWNIHTFVSCFIDDFPI